MGSALDAALAEERAEELAAQAKAALERDLAAYKAEATARTDHWLAAHDARLPVLVTEAAKAAAIVPPDPIPGKDGEPGKAGTDGSDGLDGESIRWRGKWSSRTRYDTLDAVERKGSSYICTAPNQGQDPEKKGPWDLMAQKGQDGLSGPRYIPRGGGDGAPGGSALTVKDEGVSLDTAVTSIDFAGTGISASAVGHAVTVTVAAGVGGGITLTRSETDPGAIGAGNLWLRIDPEATWAPTLQVRNAANTGWEDDDGSGYLLGLSWYDGTGVLTATVSGTDHSINVAVFDADTLDVIAGLGLGTGGFTLETADGRVTASGDGFVHIDSTLGVKWNTEAVVTLPSFAAVDPDDIVDPTAATAEDVALKLNALMAALRSAGWLA